jgi:bile acid:Na+ symporter, BASS family
MLGVIDIAIPLITFVLMTAVGMDLTLAHFDDVRRRPLMLAAGLIAPVVLLPALALLLVAAFQPPTHVAAGLLLVAACPIGGISNTYSYLAQASTALSVALTTLSCALAAITIPAISRGFEFATGTPMGFAAPAVLPAQLFLMVVLPVLIGMTIRHRWPGIADENRAGLQRAAFVAVGLLLALVIGSNWTPFVDGLSTTAPLAGVFVLLSLVSGWSVAASLGATAADRFTLATEFATRNVAVATAIAVTLLGEPTFAIFAATYFLTEQPILLGATVTYRWLTQAGIRSSAVTVPPPYPQ